MPNYAWSVAHAEPHIWHSMSCNASCDVLVAGEAGGQLHVSRDGGVTWTTGNSPSGTWISSAVSAGGEHLYAVQYGGGMYTSTDFGVTWQAIRTSPLVFNASGVAFEAIAVSQDNQRVAAVIQDGPIVLSDDGGKTWRAAAMPDGQSRHWWRWIDSSADGRVIVAVSQNGEVFRSVDGGAQWQAVAIVENGVAVTETWYRVKVSQDGRTVALVANTFGGAPGSGIHISRDSGTTWARTFTQVADYTFLAMSADGRVVAASVSDRGSAPGAILLSSDGGASFAPAPATPPETNWRAIVMSASGDRLSAATGGFSTQSAGRIYRARGS